MLQVLTILLSITVFKLWRKLPNVCAGAGRQSRAINILRILFRVGLTIHVVHWSRNWRQSFMNHICFPGLLPLFSENTKQHADLKIEVEQ